MMHPLDVSHQRDALPSSKVLNTHLQVLPECATSHAVETTHHNYESDLAVCRRLFEGWQNNISIIRSVELAGGLESNDS